ncbi:MAG: site-specific integrase [Ignavibacteriaceae bacterium]
MATVRKRGKVIHIQWFDPVEKKNFSMSTGLTAKDSNFRKAEKYAKQLQNKLSRDYQKQKEIGILRVTLKEAFEHFERINQSKHPKTLADYIRFYNKFVETFDENLPCTAINKLNVENWLMEIKNLDLAPNTIHGYGKQLNHFLNFLFEYSYTPMFKINKEVKTKPELKEKIILDDIALTKIVKGLHKKNSNFVSAINLLMYTGLRSSDILEIRASDIDLKNRVLKYYSPKRKKFREVAFHKKLVPILKKRIIEAKGERLLEYNNVENLGRAIKRYFEDIKINHKIYTARTFRKTFISLCRSRYDIDASIVMELVGHEHQNTTDRYYNKVSIEKMKLELEKFKIPLVKKKEIVAK